MLLLFVLFLTLYPWFFYPLVLFFLSRIGAGEGKKSDGSGLPLSVSVIIAAHNEEQRIISRIKNILQCHPPGGNLEIIAVSNGSTDRTREIVTEAGFFNVIAFDNAGVRGRAGAHNEAVRRAQGEILLFTDADTFFEKDFIVKVEQAFANPEVGLVSGTLHYRNKDATDLTRSVGLYWRFELWLRHLESQLNIYAFASGACVAVRRKLYRDIPPTGDVDFTTPLDVVIQGYRCLHLSDAIAVDEMPQTSAGEFKARVRMTSKNLKGTLQRWGKRNWAMHPVYSWVILSHKIMRWLTPIFLILLLAFTLFLLGTGDRTLLIQFVLGGQVLFYSLAVLGRIAQSKGISIPLATQVYSFMFANAAFLVGIWQILNNKVPASYTK